MTTSPGPSPATRRLVPIAVITLLAIGWILAFWYMVAHTRLEDRLEEQVAAVGRLRELEQRGAALEATAAGVQTNIQVAEEQLAARQAELAELQAQVQATQGNLATRQLELQTLDARLAPLREELQGFHARLAEVQQRLAARSQELAEVGDQLTDVRSQEAEIQGRVATLSELAARLTSQVAEAEERLQVAREAEAALRETVVTANSRVDELNEEQRQLSHEVMELTTRREHLLADTEDTAQQREALQAMVTEITQVLAARSRDLAELESRIAEMQTAANEAAGALINDAGPAVDVRLAEADRPGQGPAQGAQTQPGDNQPEAETSPLSIDGAGPDPGEQGGPAVPQASESEAPDGPPVPTQQALEPVAP